MEFAKKNIWEGSLLYLVGYLNGNRKKNTFGKALYCIWWVTRTRQTPTRHIHNGKTYKTQFLGKNVDLHAYAAELSQMHQKGF